MSASGKGYHRVLPGYHGGGTVPYDWDDRAQDPFTRFARFVIRGEYEGFSAGVQNVEADSEEEILGRLGDTLEEHLEDVETVPDGEEGMYAEKLLEEVDVTRRMRPTNGAIGVPQEFEKDGYALSYPR